MKGRLAVFVAAVVVATSCSGGGDDATSSTSPVTDGGIDVTQPTEPPSTGAESDSPTSDAPTSTAAPTTAAPTTTTEPPQPYRAGVVWDEPVEVLSARTGLERFTTRSFDLGGELWVVAQRYNASVAARSSDGGRSWTEVSFGPPPSTGATHVDQLARGSDGRYVAIAERESSCRNGVPVGDGFTDFLNCRRRQPVVFLSDDGTTWTETAPVGLTPPGGSSLRINDLIVTDNSYIAAGTIEGPNWRAVLFTSPDGVTWTAEREFAGDGNPMSSRSLAFDGDTMVLITAETPCDGINDNTEGWDLGAGAARHGRIFIGSDIASLTLQQPGEHPLAPEPLVAPTECGVIDGIPFSFYPYPGFHAEVIDGTMTIFERHTTLQQRVQIEAAEDADDDDLAEELRSTIGTRRWAQLVGNEWVATEISGVTVRSSGNEGLSRATPVAGDPAFVELRRAETPVFDSFIVTDDEPPQVQSLTPVVISGPLAMIGTPDGVVLIALQARDPFLQDGFDGPRSIVAWHTTSGEGRLDGCNLEPGGYCVSQDLTEHPDYPDFSGRDLAGVNLTGTELGSAVFDGADLSGATLRLVTSEGAETPTFDGTDLTDALLQRAELGDISGATVDGATLADAEVLRADGVDFSNAVMLEAQIDDITGALFGSTDVTGARFIVRTADEIADLTALTYDGITISVDFDADELSEIDLSGLDLTGVSFEGNFDPPTVITGLDGAVLSDTSFRNVDLTRLDPSTDLTQVNAAFGTICPDGEPAEGQTCVRS